MRSRCQVLFVERDDGDSRLNGDYAEKRDWDKVALQTVGSESNFRAADNVSLACFIDQFKMKGLLQAAIHVRILT